MLIVSVISSRFLIKVFAQYGVPVSIFLVASMSFVWTGFLIRKDSKRGAERDDLL